MGKISSTDLILNKDGSVYHLNLKPQHLTDTILTVGDPGRVYAISKYFDKLEFEMNKREFITHIGRLNGKRIMAISTGMGTDNIEIFFNEIDALANIDLKTREIKARKRKLKIIRIGTSGGLQPDLPVDSLLASEHGVGLDNLMTFYDYQSPSRLALIAERIREEIELPFTPYMGAASGTLLAKFGEGMKKGNTVTCPGFYAPQGRKLRLPIKFPHLLDRMSYFHEEDFWLTNFEMETAAYYALAQMLGHEMLSLNVILANRSKNIFSKDPTAAIDKLIKSVLERMD